ncbi:MAG: V-type ATP synthase subunit E [Spirochaetales bacterium]|nr:V-type ATP synthase subunit E [Spirochaetales bacterium]
MNTRKHKEVHSGKEKSKMEGQLGDEKGKEKLITGINDDAQKEAEKIIKQAETYAGERKQAIEKQVNTIMDQARAKAHEQVESIRRNMKSAIAVEIKRLNLKIMDRIMSTTIQRVKERIAGKIITPEYPGIFLGWIIEAAIGLNVNEAYVNTSAQEREYITTELLKKASDTLFTLTGKRIELFKSEEDPYLAQGIVLYAKDGKTAFNNQVPTRLLRYQSEVRKMIYDMLYGKKKG